MTQTNKRVRPAGKRRGGSACCGGLSEFLSPKLFKALADPRRVGLLVRLAEARTACTVSEIARGTDIDISVVSRHLAMLREAGVIECVKIGKEVRCSVRARTLSRLLRDLADALDACCPEQCCEGDRSPGNPGKEARS